MKTLIVATDFSAIARNATQYAMEMARSIQADVHLLHVYQMPVNYGAMDIPISMPEWEQETEDLMSGVKRQLELNYGGVVSVSTECQDRKLYAGIGGCMCSQATLWRDHGLQRNYSR